MTLIIFIVLLATSMPVAICLGLASVITLFIDGIPISMAVQRMLASTNSFPIMAILFFMLSGEIMSKGNMTKKLISVAEACVGFIKGGLAITASLASLFFSAISGSSAATCASIGTIMIEQMEKKGYDKEFAASVIAASGITGIVIPPSITLVVYGVVTGTSVGKLFIGGLLPGFIMGLSIAAYSIFASYKNDYGEVRKFDIKEIWKQIKESFFVLMMPVIILGGIYGGIFTPTEAAVVSVVYALIITLFVEHSLDKKDLGGIFIKSIINSAVILVIIQNATVFSWILTNARVPHTVGQLCASISQNKIVFLMLLNIVFLISGTLVTGSAIVAILAPIFLPVAIQYGIDPVFLGVLMVINLAIGYITPPVGVDLYVASTIAKLPIERVIIRVMPYLLILLVDLIIITYVPGIIMFFPNLM